MIKAKDELVCKKIISLGQTCDDPSSCFCYDLEVDSYTQCKQQEKCLVYKKNLACSVQMISSFGIDVKKRLCQNDSGCYYESIIRNRIEYQFCQKDEYLLDKNCGKDLINNGDQCMKQNGCFCTDGVLSKTCTKGEFCFKTTS